MIEEDSMVKVDIIFVGIDLADEVGNHCFACFSTNHLCPDYPWKYRTDLKFCSKCGVREHSLEVCSIILEKIMSKNNVNLLFNVTLTKNLVTFFSSFWNIKKKGYQKEKFTCAHQLNA